jgi:hypothetical protein
MLSEWLTAHEALELVRGATSLYQAHRAICSRAHAGLLAARATRLIIGSKVEDDAEVPAGFWWAEGETALEQNWGTGDFATWIDQRVQCRAFGVKFSRVGIESMLGKPDRPTAADHFKVGNYATAATCLAELQAALRCEGAEAERLILKSCRAGLVESRCSSFDWRVTNRYGEVQSKETNVCVPHWFWDHCADDPDAVLNWGTGRFAARGTVDGDAYKTIIAGVEFEVSGIVEIESQVRTALPLESKDDGNEANLPPPNLPVGRRLSEQWRPWIAELVAEVHNHGVPAGVGSQGQEELIKRVADALAKRGIEGLGRSTVQPVVQAVLNRMRDAEI